MALVVAAVVGAACGQVLTLSYDRLFSGVKLGSPLSICSRCGQPVTILTALPLVAYLRNTGRCAGCDTALPPHAIILPLGGVALFAASALAFGELGAGLLGGFFATIFLTLALTDLERRLLPNRLVYPATILAVIFSWGWPSTSVALVFAGGATGVLIALVLLAMSLPFRRDAMGMGDAKMLVLVGFVVGWPWVVVAVTIGLLATAVCAGFLLVTRLRGLGDYIPQGPFLALGAILTLFLGAAMST